MKTICRKNDGCRVTSDTMKSATRATPFCHVSAFTLIELLVVMAVIGAVAAMLLGVVGAVKKKQYIYTTQAEMEKIETAIERYKAVHGVYPPDNHRNEINSSMVNPLYYELTGTTNTGSSSAP